MRDLQISGDSKTNENSISIKQIQQKLNLFYQIYQKLVFIFFYTLFNLKLLTK